jgi:ribonuclease P protein component
MTVVVPKKLIKKAVDRNVIKRRTREIFRLNKNLIYEQAERNGLYFEILFLYQANQISDYNTISNSVKELLHRMSAIIRKTGKPGKDIQG